MTERILHRCGRDHDPPREAVVGGVEDCRPPVGALPEGARVGEEVERLGHQIPAALVGELGNQGCGNDDDERAIRDVAVDRVDRPFLAVVTYQAMSGAEAMKMER